MLRRRSPGGRALAFALEKITVAPPVAGIGGSLWRANL